MSKTILLVDDSLSVRTVMRSALEPAGYQVCEAEDGLAALKLLDDQPVQLIVSDSNMPNMDGTSFIKQLRKGGRSRFTPVIMLTTETRSEMRQQFKEAGAQAFLPKPCKPSTLLDAVRRFCP